MNPDLQISLSGTPEVGPGALLIYSLEITNAGDVTPAGTDVVVVNTLPTEFEVSGIIPGGGFFVSNTDNNVITFTASSLGSAESATITIIGTVAQGTTANSFVSTAAVDPPIASGGNIGEGGGANETNNTATLTTTIDTALGPDLSITKIAGPDSVEPGGTVIYTVTVANEGQATASNIEVVDDLPANFRVSSVITGGNFTSNFNPSNSLPDTITFSGGTLAASEDATFTIIGTAPDAPDDITNVVSVDPNNQITEGGQVNANNTVTITTDVDVALGPNLTISKFDGPDPVAPGGALVYTLEVTNNGSAAATNIVVRDSLDANFSLSSVIPGGNFTPDTSVSGQVTFSGGTLAAGASATFTLIGTAPEAASAQLVNIAVVDPENGILEGDESAADNIETITTNVDAAAGPNLTISKFDGPDPVAPGGALVYTLEVTNNGSAAATNIVVRDSLDANFSLSSVIPGGNFTPDTSVSGQVTFSGGTLAAGASATFTLIGTAPQIASGQLVNVAVVDPENTIIEADESAADNIETITTSVDTTIGPNLSISKLDGPDPVAPGGALVYTLEVTNNGSAAATNVVVRDDLPDEFTATSVIPGGNFTSNFTSQGQDMITFSGGTLGINESATFTIIGTVSANPTSNQLINTAVADPAVVGEDLTDNTATSSTTISLPDLTIEKMASASSVVAGDTVIYTLTVNNEGPVPANNILVQDALPGNFLIDSIISEGGFTNSAVPVAPNRVPPGVVSFSGGSLAAGGSATFTIIGRFTSAGELVNTVVADPNNSIAEDNNTNNAENNNTATVSVSVAAPTLVFVDDNWATLAIGDDVDPDGAGTEFAMGDGVFGINAFDNIQGGEQAVASGGTVRVFAGTYGEIVGITKPVSLIGPNASTNPNTQMRVDEATITGTSAGIGFLAGADAGQVIIDGFRLEGPGTGPGEGATIDTRNAGNNTIIRNNVITNIDNDAIRNFAESNPALPKTRNLVIQDNLIDGITGNGSRRAMFLQDVENVTISGNVVRNIANQTMGGGDNPGILLDTVTGEVLINNNRLENIASQGIQVAGIGSIDRNNPGTAATGTANVTISNNNLTNVNTRGDIDNAGIRLRDAIPLGSFGGTGAVLRGDGTATVSVTGNTIEDTTGGLFVRTPTDVNNFVTVSGNFFINISDPARMIVNQGTGTLNAPGIASGLARNVKDFANAPLDAGNIVGSVDIAFAP